MSIPLENPEQETIKAAIKMIQAVRKVSDDLRLRVGIASGPLIGIFIYLFNINCSYFYILFYNLFLNFLSHILTTYYYIAGVTGLTKWV